MMNFVGPMLVFSGWGILFAVLRKQRFEECLPAALMALSVFVYALTWIADFRAAAIFSIIPAAAGAGCIVFYLRKKEGRALLEWLFTPGFFLFWILGALLLWMNWNRGLMRWDETSHWALMVKETLRVNDFYCVDASSLLAHKDYPPIVCLFEALYCRLSGGYREGKLYAALQLLELSFFFPFLAKTSWFPAKEERPSVKTEGMSAKTGQDRADWKKYVKQWIGFFVVCTLAGAGVLFCGIPDNPFFSSLYEDNILALELAFGFWCVFRKREICWSDMSLVCVFLLMTKQMGLVFYALLLFFAAVKTLVTWVGESRIRQNKAGESGTAGSPWKNREMLRKAAGVLLWVLVLPLGLYLSWKVEIGRYGVDEGAQFQLSAIRPGLIADILAKTGGEEWQIVSGQNYLQALYGRELHHYGISCSYLLMLLVFAVIFAALALALRNTGFLRRIVCAGSVALAGGVGYAFAMFLLYVFSFGPQEGPVLASYERYMNTYLYALWLIVVMLALHAFTEYGENKTWIFAAGCLGACLAALYLATGDAGSRIDAPKTYVSINQEFASDARYLEEHTPEDARILFLDQTLDEYHFRYACYAFRYLLNPRIFPAQDWKSRMENASPEEMERELENWDYVYVIHADEQWQERYGALFEEELRDHTLIPLK